LRESLYVEILPKKHVICKALSHQISATALASRAPDSCQYRKKISAKIGGRFDPARFDPARLFRFCELWEPMRFMGAQSPHANPGSQGDYNCVENLGFQSTVNRDFQR
jgi:hypothetical protein